MVFTIQFVREFARMGLTRSVGGVLGLALSRELTPVVTAIIMAGRVGSAFAAELGTMAVSEQTDSLRVLGTDPTDYLVVPRVLACMVAGPVLNLLCFCMGMAASTLLAEAVYDVTANVILDSAARVREREREILKFFFFFSPSERGSRDVEVEKKRQLTFFFFSFPSSNSSPPPPNKKNNIRR